MKKSIVIVLSLLCAASLFAADITFPGPAVNDVRSRAMGGQHVADYSDYFTLYRNPAFLEKSGKHWYWDTLTLNVGGPLEQAENIMGLVDQLSQSGDMDPAALMNDPTVTAILGNGLNLGLSLNIPMLSFGGIGKNFGWGVYNKADVKASLPSMMGKASVLAMVESSFILGYGDTIAIADGHDVSYGISTRIYSQLPQVGTKAKVMDIMNNPDALMEEASVQAKAGFAVDLAAAYSFNNLIDTSIVVRNAIAPTYSAKASMESVQNGDFEDLTNLNPDSDWTKPTVGFGVGVKIPTWWSMGIISSWKVYADDYDVVNLFVHEGLARNPILDVGVGTEISLLRILDLRAGISDGYLNAGIGINLGAISWDFALYGKELSTQPGGTPQLNATLAMTLQR